jgi:flavin-dependent dehydrogenase
MTDVLVIGAGPAGAHSALLPDLRGHLVSVAVKAAHELGLAIGWQAHQAA